MDEANYTYKLYNDGYDIYRDGSIMMTQRDPYGNLFIPDGSYEDNAKAHIAELSKPQPEPLPTDEELLRADVDFIALVEGLELPSQDVVPEEEGE